MADSVNEQSSASGMSASRLVRYPLRSGSKQKEEKPSVADSASASRRGRSVSNVSKSVSVLNLSVKEKSTNKPPRRLSNPLKTAVSPASRPSSSITPISGIRGKIQTPVSDVQKSSSKKKFNVLSSSSYWLTQIKLSETAAKHSVSLGFFKLAFEAGCEPVQRIRGELKSYTRRHNLAEFGESVKELFEKYNITENIELLQVSETCSYAPEEGTRSSGEDSVGSNGKVKRNLLAGDAAETRQINQPKKEKIKKVDLNSKVRKPVAEKSPSNLKSPAVTHGQNSQKKIQKAKQELNNDMIKKSPEKSAHEDSIDSLPVDKTLEENKENSYHPEVDEIGSSEV